MALDKVETHSNKVLDMKGNVLQSSAEIRFTDTTKEGLKKPDAVGSALLCARRMFNECEDITDQVKALGMDLGESAIQDTKNRVIKIHYYSWGLFWTTLLRALKGREDLRAWSPDLFEHDEVCASCDGRGRIFYEVGTEQYNEAYEDFKDKIKYGEPIGQLCRPCQAVGYIYKKPKENS